MSATSYVPLPFGVSVEWAPGMVVLTPSGELDMLTAPVLEAVLSALDESDRGALVLDMASISFMGAAGLRVIALTSAKREGNGGLTIRSPRPTVRWLLDHFDLGGVVEAAPIPLPLSGLGAALPAEDPSEAALSPEALAPQVGRGMLAPARNELIDAALRLVSTLAQATIGGADGVSVTIARHGQLTTVAATDETIAEMDRDQYSTGEGPCLSAAAEGRVFHVPTLADEHRWPQFVPRAINDGIGSILSNPLMVETRPVGALNIYSKAPRGFGPKDQELAAILAAEASGMLAEAGFDLADAAVAARLLSALQTRAVISQAQGVVMAHEGGSADAAFASLRDASKETGVPIRQQASEVLAGARRTELVGDGSP